MSDSGSAHETGLALEDLGEVALPGEPSAGHVAHHTEGASAVPLATPADAAAGETPGVGPTAQGRLADPQQRGRLGDVEQLRIERHESGDVPL
jgi:hypothetical protein